MVFFSLQIPPPIHLRPVLAKSFLPLLIVLCCSGCNLAPEPVTARIFSMDTYMELQAYGKNAERSLDEVGNMIRRLDQELDRTTAGSLTYIINHALGKPVSIDKTMHDLIAASLRYGELTGGKFDITVAPLADAWGFTRDSFRVPSSTEIETLLPCVGSEHIHLLEDQVILDPGTQLDFGGIAKGLAVEGAANIFQKANIENGLADLGGDLLVLGEKPGGHLWRVGIQSPFSPDDPSELAGVLETTNSFVLTSGNYQRCFEENNTTYHHIIDPTTGSPATNGLSSVTVISEIKPGYGMMCDALATALFTMGVDEAVDFWRENAALFQMILISDSGDVWITNGLESKFQADDTSRFSYCFIS